MNSFAFMIQKAVRGFFFILDKGIYSLLETAYKLVHQIADTGTELLGDGVITSFASRVYLFLGIFMLFKMSVSLINYFINPDSFTDSKTGMGSVLKRIIISLILIVTVPFIFRMTMEFQKTVLDNNILASVVFGDNGDAGNAQDWYENGGAHISVSIFQAFFRPNGEATSEYTDVETVRDYDPLIDSADDNNEFDYEYSIPMSTIAGGLATWVMVMFCFDVAVRSVKYVFLQLIAPVPIISYIDPKKGNEIFSKWVSECVSTYLSLFLRLIALYFVIFLVAEFSQSDWWGTDSNFFLRVFILLGLLLFAKEAPKLVMNIFGIKDSGGFTLNPLKKIQSSPVAAGALGAAGGLIGGFAANTWSLASRAKKAGGFGELIHGDTPVETVKNAFSETFSPLGGSISASLRGGYAGLQGKGGAIKGISDASMARNLRRKGYGFSDKVRDKATDIAGIKAKTGTTSILKDRANQLRQELANSKQNELTLNNAFNQMMSEQGRAIPDLTKTFNREIEGDGYKNIMYQDYQNNAISRYIEEYNADPSHVDKMSWDQFTDQEKQDTINELVRRGAMVDGQTFKQLHDIYQAQGKEDIKGRNLEKEINNLTDDIDTFKKGGKK